MKLEGKTFPQSREIKATEERLPNLKKFLQNAVRKEFVNEFGQQVTRAGTMGGQVLTQFPWHSRYTSCVLH